MKRILLVFAWIVTLSTVSFAQTIFFPQVANGVQPDGTIWKTTIYLTNPASTGGPTASGTITFTQENSSDPSAAGQPFNITIVNETGQGVGGVNPVPFALAPGQSRKFISTGTGEYQSGFATVSSTAPIGGTSIFSKFDAAGRLQGEAGVPGAVAVPRQTIFVDTTSGFNIGVAYANPDTSSATVTLSLLNSSAIPVIPTPRSQVLGPGNHVAAFTFQLFPGVPELNGTMQITSATPLPVIALRFDRTFSIFTTLPPVTIGSLLNPALEWLDHRQWLAPLTSLARIFGALQLRIG